MKKTLIALTVAAAAVSVQAAPQANSFYAGAKAGWASFHDGINQLDNVYGGKYSINKHAPTYGVFAGYQLTDNLAAEVGYDYFGRVRGKEQNARTLKEKQTFKHSAHGTVLSLKGSYPVFADLDIYARAGIALVNNRYKLVDMQTREKTTHSRFQTSALVGGGIEYAITSDLAARVEYQWLNNVGKANEEVLAATRATDYRPDVGSVSAGISYRFGQGALPVDVAPEIITKSFAFNSDVLFDFNKSSLKSSAGADLDNAYNEINKLGLAQASVQVNGYTDRLGSDAYNMKLSQKRAETVANYLVAKGTAPESITAVGYGKANPVTGNTCDAVKGRQALIACLAPDRRVEVQVHGSKNVVM